LQTSLFLVTNFMLSCLQQIAISPHKRSQVALVTEDGDLQLWDTRGSERPEHSFAVHSGPVYSVAWHPQIRFRIATGGRDRSARVWDLGTDNALKLESAIFMNSSVGAHGALGPPIGPPPLFLSPPVLLFHHSYSMPR
jgi:WD40 repeat protein